MQIKWIFVAGCLAALWTAHPALAKDKKGAAGEKKEKPAATASQNAATPDAAKSDKKAWAGIDVTISAPEKEVIREYVHTHTEGKKKSKGLPPGLAKKVARGGELPPGWQKKVVRGEVLSEAVYKECHPLPPEIVVKLPTPPPGTILVSVDGKIVRLAKATREILDVFDVRP